MWVVFLKNIVTPSGAGPYYLGQRLDLPDRIVAEVRTMGKGNLRQTCPPWEDHLDRGALELAGRQARCAEAQALAEKLAAEADALAPLVEPLTAPAAEAQKAATRAQQKANSAAKKAEGKNATDAVKQKAAGLAREADRASLDSIQCNARLQLALAEARLKRLDAKDAARHAKTFAAELAVYKAEQAEARVDPQAPQSEESENGPQETAVEAPQQPAEADTAEEQAGEPVAGGPPVSAE